MAERATKKTPERTDHPAVMRATQRPEVTVFLVALLLRLIIGSVSALADLQPRLAPDTAGYTNLLRERRLGNAESFQGYSQWLYEASWSFLRPIEWAAWSPSAITPLAIISTAVAGAVLAALTTRLLILYTSRTAAFAGGLIIALMPSQIIWSSMLLKDAYIAMAIAGTALALRWWCSQTSATRYIAGTAVLVALLLYISRIRLHTLTAVLIGVVLALVIASPNRRVLRSFTAVILLLFIPLTAGSDFGNSNILSTLTGGMEDQRALGAIDASTAVVAIPGTQTEPGTQPEPGT